MSIPCYWTERVCRKIFFWLLGLVVLFFLLQNSSEDEPISGLDSYNAFTLMRLGSWPTGRKEMRREIFFSKSEESNKSEEQGTTQMSQKIPKVSLLLGSFALRQGSRWTSCHARACQWFLGFQWFLSGFHTTSSFGMGWMEYARTLRFWRFTSQALRFMTSLTTSFFCVSERFCWRRWTFLEGAGTKDLWGQQSNL